MKIKMIFLAVGLAMASGNLYATDKELVELAEQGNAGAQYHLGKMYSNGQGVKQDYQKAFMATPDRVVVNNVTGNVKMTH